jgi:hypothetical protein
LRPEGWSADQLKESLDLNELTDNDPKAREALQKIREMWDNAPVNPNLASKCPRVAGSTTMMRRRRRSTGGSLRSRALD